MGAGHDRKKLMSESAPLAQPPHDKFASYLTRRRLHRDTRQPFTRSLRKAPPPTSVASSDNE